ncbi:PAS domain S-box protein [Tepidiforma thermophila]|uniref:histidine kinase n=1 Tax=Tepidiforma thermophila (strain KCTC 52669 / CGMCC 1.13589 / G233) TaxID=2761530 RepID=A0A2A9HEJ6_TEPT2|nr:PAS domain S-box protein [Tepidiforma thermophila]PFG73435.1 PAS domain S-box-containing protein [Tepidiforma thermophila]
MTNPADLETPELLVQRYLELSAEYEQFRYHLPEALIEFELPSARVTSMNRLAEVLLGYTVEDVLAGLYGYQVVDEESWRRALRAGEEDFAGTVHKGLPYERRPGQQVHRFTAIRKDGSRFPIEAQGSYIVDARGVPTGVRFLFRDISARVAAEREHARLAAIVESAGDAIVSRDLEGRILSWNRGAEALYGWTAAEMIGRTADVLAPPGREDEVRELTERVKRGEHVQVTTRRRARDGRIIDVELSLFPVRDEAGQVMAIGGIAREITERLRMTEELERTNRLLGAISRAQAEFIASGDHQAVFEGLLAALLDLTESEYGFIGETMAEPGGAPKLRAIALTYPEDPADRARLAEAAPPDLVFENLDTLFGVTLRTGEPVISNDPGSDPRAHGTPPGHPRLTSYLGLPIVSRGEVVGMVGVANRPGGYSDADVAFLRPFLATCATLIEALRAEEQRLAAERRLAAALERSEITLWEWDVARDEMVAFAGNSEGAPPQPGLPHWLERVHPDDRRAVVAAFEAHLRAEASAIDVEHRYLLPGGGYGWYLTRGRIIERAPNGRPLRAVGSFLNITRRKEAELERERLELLVRQAQKLESLGVLAGGVAHDFNNLLTAVLGNLYLLRQAAPADPALRELIDDAAHAAERGAGLVRRLLAFGRPDIAQDEVVDLDELIAESAALARPMVEPQVKLVIRGGPGKARVKGSASALEQVLVNLFVNARDAMPEGGTITVTRTTAELGSRRRWAPPELPRGRYHVIAVRDTGTGMPPEVLEKIFDPFFTTKPVGRGSGLGLPTALAIARAHGGWLSAESTPGRGSIFRLLLPVLAEGDAR